MFTTRQVLLTALEDALRPLEDSIVANFCRIYNCSTREIDKPIELERLVDMVNSVVQQQSLEESAAK